MYFHESENIAIEMSLNQGRLVQDKRVNLREGKRGIWERVQVAISR